MNKKKEKNVGNFWPNITLIPLSRLFYVVKYWNYSNIFKYTNLSSPSHESNQMNIEEFSHQVENNYELWKYDYVQKLQGEIFLHNPLSLYAGLDLTASHLEEGENDKIRSLLSMWKETYKKFTWQEPLVGWLVPNKTSIKSPIFFILICNFCFLFLGGFLDELLYSPSLSKCFNVTI